MHKPHCTPHFTTGQRVKTLPHTDAFMMGARYGTVVGFGGDHPDDSPKLVNVRMDADDLVWFYHPSNIAPLEV
jgi:hypothetical protein